MLSEVYYKNYKEHCETGCELGPKSLPYAIREVDPDKREGFRSFLESQGFECVSWNDIFPVILVNLDFKRFGINYLPIKHSSVGDSLYKLDEFLDEVYRPNYFYGPTK